MANYSYESNTTVAAAAAAAAPPAGPGRRRLGQLEHRCRRCCRYCGISFIAVFCLLLNIILIQYVICINLFYFYIIFIIGGSWW